MEINPNKNHSKEQSIINAERQSYLFRLRKKSFQDLELSKCTTVTEILQVTQDIQEAEFGAQTNKKLSESQIWKDFKMYSDSDDYPGIPITVKLDKITVEKIIAEQNKNSYKVISENDFYNQDQYELFCDKKIESIYHALENTLNDEIKKFNHTSGFDRYKEKIENGDFANVIISGMQLPGNGMYYKSCMMYQIKGCVDSSHLEEYSIYQDQVKRILKKCNKLSCPKCWTFTINKQALSVVDRIEATLSFKKNRLWMENKKSRIYNHLVVSIPKSRYDKCETHEGRLKIERNVFKKLKSIGIEGGVSIYHPFRFTKGLESVYFSPHIHILGFGYTDKNDIKALYDKTGLVVKSINTFNDSQTAFTTVKYLLSHTGVSDNKHRIKYFGQAGNNKFSTKTILAKSISSIDDISYHVSSWNILRHQSKGMFEDVPLEQVSLSLVSYHDDKDNIKSLREVDFDSFDLSNCTINDITKRIQGMVLHIDNPAKAKSTSFDDELQQTPPHQFLHIRRAYSIEKSKTIYRYETIIIDFEESDICPICTRKLHLMEPIDPGGGNFIDLPLDEIASVDCEIYRYVENFSDPRGQMYFNEDGVMSYDDGVPIPGPYHLSLPDSVKSIHDKMIHRCKIKASIRLETGKTPTNKEIDAVITTQQKISESLEWHKTSLTSQKIIQWFNDDNYNSLRLSKSRGGGME